VKTKRKSEECNTVIADFCLLGCDAFQSSIYYHVRECDCRRFCSEIGFIDHFNTRLVTAPNYSAIADLHTLQISTTRVKSLPACIVFTSRFPVTDFNSGDSSASVLTLLLSGEYPATLIASAD
jgi:hypothetical protein